MRKQIDGSTKYETVRQIEAGKISLFIGGQTVGGIVFLVLAFLVSPFGVPAIAEWLVDRLHSAKFALRDFITG